MSNTQSIFSILPAHNPAPAPGFSNVSYAPGNQVPYGYPPHAPGSYQGRLPGYRSTISLGNNYGKDEGDHI